MPAQSRIWTLGLIPPGKDAARTAHIRFVRNLQIRMLPISLLMWIVVLSIAPGWLALVVAVMVVLGALDTAYLTWRLRRTQ
jgi:hypothetical protein